MKAPVCGGWLCRPEERKAVPQLRLEGQVLLTHCKSTRTEGEPRKGTRIVSKYTAAVRDTPPPEPSRCAGDTHRSAKSAAEPETEPERQRRPRARCQTPKGFGLGGGERRREPPPRGAQPPAAEPRGPEVGRPGSLEKKAQAGRSRQKTAPRGKNEASGDGCVPAARTLLRKLPSLLRLRRGFKSQLGLVVQQLGRRFVVAGGRRIKTTSEDKAKHNPMHAGLCVRVCASRHLLGHGDRRLGESGRTQRPRAPAAPEQRSARQQGQASVKGSVRGPWPCPEAGDGHPAWTVPRPSGTRPGPGLSPEAAQSPAQTLPKGGQRPSFCVLIFAGWGETCWSRR